MRIENLAEEGASPAKYAQGDGQIEGRSFLAHVRRCKVHRDRLYEWIVETAIAERRADTFTAFAHGIIGEADDVEDCLRAWTYIDFNFNEVCVYSKYCCAERFEKHHKGPSFRAESVP